MEGCPGVGGMEDANSYLRLWGVRIGCCWHPATERPRLINKDLDLEQLCLLTKWPDRDVYHKM